MIESLVGHYGMHIRALLNVLLSKNDLLQIKKIDFQQV